MEVVVDSSLVVQVCGVVMESGVELENGVVELDVEVDQ